MYLDKHMVQGQAYTAHGKLTMMRNVCPFQREKRAM
jgi:hypothetical protein